MTSKSELKRQSVQRGGKSSNVVEEFDGISERIRLTELSRKQLINELIATRQELEKYQWKSIETLSLNDNVVLLFSKEWVDPDFNPEGIREGFCNEDDDGPIYSAAWNPCHDCWETVITEDATHWIPRLLPPTPQGD